MLHPLEELSGLVDPSKAQHPAAREAVVNVVKGLRKVLRAERWPKPFQISGAAFCELAGDRALIADEQGVGKTITAICRILLKRHFPAVVVAPPTPLLNWKEEFRLWAPGLEVHRLDKVDRWVPRAGFQGVVITTWDLLPYHAEALAKMQPRIVVGDEAHYILNEETERSFYFQHMISKVPHLLLLTGTPQKNRPQELWRLLNLIDPRAWSEVTLPAFKNLNKDDFDRGAQSRLVRRVRQYMVRRLKKDATPELGEKRVQTLLVQIPEAQMAAYREVERRFSEWLEDKIQRELETEEAAGEISFDDDAVRAHEAEKRFQKALQTKSLVQTGQLRQIVGRLKAPIAARWIVEVARAGEAVVAFAHHEEVIDVISTRLAQSGVKFGVIVGKTPKTRRHSLVKEFQGGKIDVILCSGAAREGVTLTRARHVLFCERFWTPAEEDQAADRVHRISQTREVFIWKMKAVGTMDTRMDEVNVRKRRVISRAVEAQSPGR